LDGCAARNVAATPPQAATASDKRWTVPERVVPRMENGKKTGGAAKSRTDGGSRGGGDGTGRGKGGEKGRV